MEAWYVPGCGANLRYVELPGRAPTLVFLHGWLGSSTGWYTHIAACPPLAGTRIVGPAIVEERETTAVIRPGWVVEVAADGSLVAERSN